MADLIKIKGGTGSVPALQDRELAYSKDEKALYIGTNNTTNGNVKVGDAGWESRIQLLETKVQELEASISELETATKEYIDDLMATINARLEILENPSE